MCSADEASSLERFGPKWYSLETWLRGMFFLYYTQGVKPNLNKGTLIKRRFFWPTEKT